MQIIRHCQEAGIRLPEGKAADSAISVRKDGVELLLLKPIEFRRIYTLNFDEGISQLSYSHSDILVELDSGAPAMIDVIQCQLNSGKYNLKFMPTQGTVEYKLSKNGPDCMKYLKRLVFMHFPDLPVRDLYLNEDLPFVFIEK